MEHGHAMQSELLEPSTKRIRRGSSSSSGQQRSYSQSKTLLETSLPDHSEQQHSPAGLNEIEWNVFLISVQLLPNGQPRTATTQIRILVIHDVGLTFSGRRWVPNTVSIEAQLVQGNLLGSNNSGEGSHR